MRKMIFIGMLLCTSLLISQNKHLESFGFSDVFAYEIDDNLRSADDMIYRKSALLPTCGHKVSHKKIFIFESSMPKDSDISHFDKQIQEKIKYASHFFNDSIHDYLKATQSAEFRYKTFNYRLFNLKFKAIYLGKIKVSMPSLSMPPESAKGRENYMV